MCRELMTFLESTDVVFIEAEARPDRMRRFIENYNLTYNENLSIYDDGIILLQDDANKWGLELRLYVGACPPEDIRYLGFTHNEDYRNDFSYRLNNNDIIQDLFEHGYRIGIN